MKLCYPSDNYLRKLSYCSKGGLITVTAINEYTKRVSYELPKDVDLGPLFPKHRENPKVFLDESGEDQNWCGEKVECDICTHQWIAVFHDDTEMLQCPNCDNMTYITIIDEDEF